MENIFTVKLTINESHKNPDGFTNVQDLVDFEVSQHLKL